MLSCPRQFARRWPPPGGTPDRHERSTTKNETLYCVEHGFEVYEVANLDGNLRIARFALGPLDHRG
jgi:hypothetical protein